LFLTEWSEIATVGDYTLHITDVLFGITMIYCLAGAIESLNAKLRRALKTRGERRRGDETSVPPLASRRQNMEDAAA
jgi:hypothetical protein